MISKVASTAVAADVFVSFAESATAEISSFLVIARFLLWPLKVSAARHFSANHRKRW
jgi:hypothetical protein